MKLKMFEWLLRIVNIYDVDMSMYQLSKSMGHTALASSLSWHAQGINVPIKWSYHFIRFQEGRILQVLALGSHETSVRRPGSVDKMAQAAAQTHSSCQVSGTTSSFRKTRLNI